MKFLTPIKKLDEDIVYSLKISRKRGYKKDIIAYAHTKVDATGNSRVVLTLRSPDNSIRCGCRFKYMPEEIPFTYVDLTKALNEAIDKEGEENNNQFLTDKPMDSPEVKSYDYDGLMAEFKDLVSKILTKNQSNAPKITAIVEKYLGKGKKVSDATPDQAEFIYLIVDDIKATLV